MDGKVIRLLHDGGEKERRKAKFWVCTCMCVSWLILDTKTLHFL